MDSTRRVVLWRTFVYLSRKLIPLIFFIFFSGYVLFVCWVFHLLGFTIQCPVCVPFCPAAVPVKQKPKGKTLHEIEEEEGGPVKESMVGMAAVQRAIRRKKADAGDNSG
jgi:hypothetical protein